MPCPAAAEAVQLVQVMSSPPQPLSAQASVMADGWMLSRYGSALVQSATTPVTGDGADGGGAVVVPAGRVFGRGLRAAETAVVAGSAAGHGQAQPQQRAGSRHHA